MTLFSETNLYSVKMNQLAKYEGQRSFRSKVIDHNAHTHRFLYLDHKVVSDEAL